MNANASAPNESLSGQDIRALFAIFLAVILGTLDIAIVNTALPDMAKQLNISPASSIWIVNAYQLAVVATLLPLAALGDQWGAKRVFLGGLAFYVVASVGCTLAHTLPQLIAARVLQGVGGGWPASRSRRSTTTGNR